MANKKDKKYLIKVTSNPTFTGYDAGNVAFANGEAIITSERMASWFMEHEGYEVTEIKEDKTETDEK